MALSQEVERVICVHRLAPSANCAKVTLMPPASLDAGLLQVKRSQWGMLESLRRAVAAGAGQ